MSGIGFQGAQPNIFGGKGKILTLLTLWSHFGSRGTDISHVIIVIHTNETVVSLFTLERNPNCAPIDYLDFWRENYSLFTLLRKAHSPLRIKVSLE